MTVYVGKGSPVFEFILPQDCMNESNQAIDKWMQGGNEQPISSNIVGTQTDTNLPLPLCQSFAVHCCKMISNLVYNAGGRTYGGLNDGTTDIEFEVRNCWGADYAPGEFVKPHNHFPADFAAVGYLRCDDGAAPIIFDGNSPYYPTERQLLIFDAKLLHEVPVTNAHRRCFAMNLYKKSGTF